MDEPCCASVVSSLSAAKPRKTHVVLTPNNAMHTPQSMPRRLPAGHPRQRIFNADVQGQFDDQKSFPDQADLETERRRRGSC